MNTRAVINPLLGNGSSPSAEMDVTDEATTMA